MDVGERQRLARQLLSVVDGYSADEGCFLLVLAIDAIVTSVTPDDRAYRQSIDMIIEYMQATKKAGRITPSETKQ